MRWLAARSLRPPDALVDEFRRSRLQVGLEAAPSWVFADEHTAASLIAGERDGSALARELSTDVQASAFPLTLERLGSRDIPVELSPGLVPLFVPSARRLFLPVWLADAPRVLFAPSSLFTSVRRSSIAWLLLDALVPAPQPPYDTVQSHYGFY